MSGLLRGLLAVATLTALYLATLASAHPLDIAAGVVIAVVALTISRPLLAATATSPAPTQPSGWRRLLAAPGFALAVCREIVAGTLAVMGYSLGLRRIERPGIVGIPIGERSATGVAVSALVTTLSPGTTLVEVDEARGVMWLHVLDARDPEGVRAAHQRFYERHQRKLFP